MKKTKITKRGTTLRSMSAGLFAVMLCSALALPIGAVDSYAQGVEQRAYTAEPSVSVEYSEDNKDDRYVGDHGTVSYNLPGAPSLNIAAHKALPLRINGRTLSESALIMNGVTYLPARAVANAFDGLNMSYSASTKTATFTAPGLYMTATHGGYVTYANGRALFAFSPTVVMSNGRMYIPATSLAKALGLGYVRGESDVRLDGGVKPLKDATAYYREDEVFWLARIIQAESGGEPLLGQMAVGNVILNRVRSAQYPNTIYGVIFDRKYGVQFSPILNGSIYNTPSYNARLAAMICLEGTLLSEDVLFFLNPVESQSSWIVKNRKYLYTILNHDFYL